MIFYDSDILHFFHKSQSLEEQVYFFFSKMKT